MVTALCTRSIQTREGIIVKALDCDGAIASRDALAKTVYARLFDWCEVLQLQFVLTYYTNLGHTFSCISAFFFSGLLIRLIGLLGKIRILNFKLGYWTFMVLNALRTIGNHLTSGTYF